METTAPHDWEDAPGEVGPRLESILQSSMDAIVVAGAGGRIVIFNEAAERIFRCRAAEALGQPLDRFVPGAGRGTLPKISRDDGAPAGEITVTPSEVRARRADGEEFTAAAKISLNEQPGQITCAVTLRDMTPRLETEAALRRLNESLERQASEIAQRLHDEAGQLLTSAYIAVARAKREVPSSAHEHLDTVKRQLDGIEQQLRRLAHELRPRILDDLGLVPALRFLADGIAERSGIAITIESNLAMRLSPLLEKTIYSFVQETLSNARRHASPSRVTIRLDHLERRLRCAVVDDGAGFDPATMTDEGGEEGMGLYTIRDRIKALDGTFHVESGPGEGTQVIVTIPMET